MSMRVCRPRSGGKVVQGEKLKITAVAAGFGEVGQDSRLRWGLRSGIVHIIVRGCYLPGETKC